MVWLMMVVVAQLGAPKGAPKAVWKKSSVSPEALARRTDASVKGLRNVSASTRSIYGLVVGQGISQGNIQVHDSQNFRIEYPYVDKRPQDFDKQAMVAGQARFGILSGTGWTKRGPLVRRAPLVPAKSLAEWPWHGGRFLFAGLGSKETPVTQLVREARQRAMRLKVEERTLFATGTIVTLQRLTIDRAGSPTLSLTVDGRSGLPVTWQTNSGGKKGQTTLFGLRWNLQPGQKFSNDLFVVPVR